MRTFRHLTRAEITDLIVRHYQGEKNSVLAAELKVDASTVSYHIKKYERAYPEQGGVYALVKADMQRVCVHPSGRCTICAVMWDELRREERNRITELERDLAEAKERLRAAGLPWNG